MPHATHKKHLIFMRGWLLGRKYNNALRAMEYASRFHTGTRKDGVTPEFSHQTEIAHFLRTMCDSMRHPEDVMTATFLHDVCEDYDIAFEEIEDLFGATVSRAVRLLSKKHRGVTIPIESYYQQLARCPIASIVKPADGDHNIRSMVGVFTREKQLARIEMTKNLVLPAIKESRRLFPDQEPVYSNIKHSLENQLHTLTRALEAA